MIGVVMNNCVSIPTVCVQVVRSFITQNLRKERKKMTINIKLDLQINEKMSSEKAQLKIDAG
jgi:hypothetical protein